MLGQANFIISGRERPSSHGAIAQRIFEHAASPSCFHGRRDGRRAIRYRTENA
jgi:hypothetical protein